MVDKINIVVAKKSDGYSVNFPELDSIDYQDSSLDEVLNKLKETLETHLRQVIQRLKINEVLTHDKHFKQEGFIILF